MQTSRIKKSPNFLLKVTVFCQKGLNSFIEQNKFQIKNDSFTV